MSKPIPAFPARPPYRGARTYYVLAKRMFQRAIELDPDYARAYAGLPIATRSSYMD